MNDSERHTNLWFLSAMEICSGLGRGAYLVCIGWTTLLLSDDVAVVGRLFLVAMLVVLFSAPFIGTVVDRHERKLLSTAAHLGIALLLAAFGTAAAPPALNWLFAIVAIVTALRMLYESAHDGLIRNNAKPAHLQRTLARFRALHLATTAIGTAGCGLLIDTLSPAAGFYFAAGCSLALALCLLGVKGRYRRQFGSAAVSYLQDLADGLRLSRKKPELLRLAMLTGVALPVGQLSNAILSSFIRDDLGRGSDVFGIVDSAWPLGGMAAAAVVSLGITQRYHPRFAPYAFALLAGLATIAFSQCASVFGLTIVHGLMGFSVWVCRILIDARVLDVCDDDTVGRAKAYNNAAFGLFAMLMCLSPSLISLPATGWYFFGWGTVAVVSTLALMYRMYRR